MTTAAPTTTAPAAPATTAAAPTGNNLTPTLTDVQLKQNIDALQKGGVQNTDIQNYVNNYQKASDGSYSLKTGAAAPSLNKNGVDVSSHPFNPANQNSQAVDTTQPAKAPGPGAFFLGSLGQGVKGTVKSLTDPLKGGVNEVKTDTAQAFKGGIDQVKQGAAEINAPNPSGNPLNLIEGVGRMGSGIVSAAFSPLAAPMKPVSNAVNYTADKISDSPTVQKFANTGFGQGVARGAENVANYANIAQGVGAFMGAPKAAETGATKLEAAVEPAKPGMTAVKNDIVTGANKVAEVAGNAKDAVQNAVQDHYTKQVSDTWAKPANAPKGFAKAQDIFNAAADKGHNIADTLAQSKINPSDNITKGTYTTADTAEQLRTDAGKMSRDMLRPSLQKADLTTPKTPVADVIATAKESIKNNPTLTQEMKDSLTTKLDDTADSLTKQHPDGMSLTNLHDEKIVRDMNAKYSPVGDIATNAEAIKNKAVADAARTTLEKTAPKDIPVKQFNGELSKQYQAANYLDALDGKKAPVGAFSKLANYGGKIAGLAVGHSVGGGILADVVGYHLGGAVERMFEGMSNPIKNVVLQNLKETNPEAFAQVEKYLGEPAPSEAAIKAANTKANPNNLVSAGGTGGTGTTALPKGMGPYDIIKNRNTTYGTKLPPGTTIGAVGDKATPFLKSGAFFPKKILK